MQIFYINKCSTVCLDGWADGQILVAVTKG